MLSPESSTGRYDAAHAFPELVTLATQRPVLNLRCVDISKQHVERMHCRVFGYGSHVDPRIHRTVRLQIYQRVIDNTSADGMALDISAVDLCDVGKLLTADEVERLLQFCDAIGLDYGELDRGIT